VSSRHRSVLKSPANEPGESRASKAGCDCQFSSEPPWDSQSCLSVVVTVTWTRHFLARDGRLRKMQILIMESG